jgi:flagellar basal body-associated protein FliL
VIYLPQRREKLVSKNRKLILITLIEFLAILALGVMAKVMWWG